MWKQHQWTIPHWYRWNTRCASAKGFTYYLQNISRYKLQTQWFIIITIIINLSLVMKYQVSSRSAVMHNQRKSNISVLKWSMQMILARLPVTTNTSAGTNIMWKKILAKRTKSEQKQNCRLDHQLTKSSLEKVQVFPDTSRHRERY